MKTISDYFIDPATKAPAWADAPIKKADPVTFVVLNSMWARDAKSVFTGGRVLRGLDPKKVKVLSLAYASDGKVAACWSGLIKDADARTFRALDVGAVPDYRGAPDDWLVEGYAADKNAVWFFEDTFAQAKKLKGVDPAHFRVLEFSFARDKDSVYYQTYRLRNAEPESFEVLDCGFAKDQARVFYGQTELKGADAASFQVVKPKEWIARDTHGYWERNARISKPR